MANFEGLLKKYKKTHHYTVNLAQCDNYMDFDDSGKERIVCTRSFATLEEAEAFVRNSIVPMIRRSVHADDSDDNDIQKAQTNPLVDMDTLKNALVACYPDLCENDGESSTISFNIEKQCFSTDTSAFEFAL